MGQILSCLFGRRTPPTPAISSDHVPDDTTSTQETVPEVPTHVRVSSATVAPFVVPEVFVTSTQDTVPEVPTHAPVSSATVAPFVVPEVFVTSTQDTVPEVPTHAPVSSATVAPFVVPEVFVYNVVASANNARKSLYSTADMKTFMKKLNLVNDSLRETYVDAKYSDREAMKKLVLHPTWRDEPPEITGVSVVKNVFMFGMYELKKAEYKSRYGSAKVKELTLIHATGNHNVDSIVRDNLDWRRVRRSLFGDGVSFSWNADYCNFYCNRNNGDRRVFIIADVLVCRESEGYQGMELSHDSEDTALSNRGYVYVKFNDNEFLPKFLVFYNAPYLSSTRRKWY